MKSQNLVGRCLQNRVPHRPLHLRLQLFQSLLDLFRQGLSAVMVHKIKQSQDLNTPCAGLLICLHDQVIQNFELLLSVAQRPENLL